MATVLFVVGIVSYAYTAFSAKPPENPVRIMYHSAAGKVLFDHKTHTADTGYGFSCWDYHHHPPEDEAAPRACGDCHNLPIEQGKLTESCADCHDENEIESSEVSKMGDAFHLQCINCHTDAGAGPEDRNSCHLL